MQIDMIDIAEIADYARSEIMDTGAFPLNLVGRRNLGIVAPLDWLAPVKTWNRFVGGDEQNWEQSQYGDGGWPSVDYRDEQLIMIQTEMHAFAWHVVKHHDAEGVQHVMRVKRLGSSLRGVLAFWLVCYRHVVDLRVVAPLDLADLRMADNRFALIRFARFLADLVRRLAVRVASLLAYSAPDMPRVFTPGGRDLRFTPLN